MTNLDWVQRGDWYWARAGHLYLVVVQWDDSEPRFDWYLMTDDEDKCHERCLDESFAGDLEIAKQDCESAALRAAAKIVLALT